MSEKTQRLFKFLVQMNKKKGSKLEKHDASCLDVTKEIFVWIGDNFGSGSRVIIHAKSSYGELYLSLEEALRTIDRFNEYGQRRILSALSLHF